jgi:NADH dehydrogenase FAD-containing subunit
VLVGGGHAHVQVVASDAGKPPFTRCLLVSDSAAAVYSGMLPSIISGLIPAAAADVHLDALAAANGWEFLVARVTAVNATEHFVTCIPGDKYPRAPRIIKFTVLSLDVGSAARPLLPCGMSNSFSGKFPIIPTRPMNLLAARVNLFESAIAFSQRSLLGSRNRSVRVVVVGCGHAGVELAFALDARLRRSLPHSSLQLSIVDGSSTPLAQLGSAASAISAELLSRKIHVLSKCRVVDVTSSGALLLDDGRLLPVDLVISATGPAAHPWLERDTDLATDENGFVLVKPTLQAVRYPHIFAAGDCCSFDSSDGPPKAGVFAVRAGKILDSNIRSFLAGSLTDLVPYVPQAHFLSLLSLGDGRAIGTKWGMVLRGRWVSCLKVRIDEDWQAQFRVPASSAQPDDVFPDSGNVWNMSALDASIALFHERWAECDDYEIQHCILKRMDEDVGFRDGILRTIANRFEDTTHG